MSTDDGVFGPAHPPSPPGPPAGYQGYPPPGYQGYPPPGYQGYPPPGYPGYAAPPPGYFPPPGYPPAMPPALKPGVIPLRPLSLSDIFNGAVAYIRANPKATLGLTTIVVVATQLLVLILSVGPLAMTGDLVSELTEDEMATGDNLSTLSSLAGNVTGWLAGILLSGLLTVVIGRAVFGTTITIGEAWRRLRGRLWALIGLTALEALIASVLLVGWFVIFFVTIEVNAVATVVIGIPLTLGAIVLGVYLWIKFSFAPVLIVLERLPVFPAIVRSFGLVRGDFWRVFGIRLLASVVTYAIAMAVMVPFTIGGAIFMVVDPESMLMVLIGIVVITLGGAVGQIITAPFSAGVVVLLYADRRIRAEAFDLVLQTGAGYGPDAPPDSTDHLWLTGQP